MTLSESEWPVRQVSGLETVAQDPYLVSLTRPPYEDMDGSGVIRPDKASQVLVANRRTGAVRSAGLPSIDGMTADPMGISASPSRIVALFSFCDQGVIPGTIEELNACSKALGAYELSPEEMTWRQLPYPEQFNVPSDATARLAYDVAGTDRLLFGFGTSEVSAYLELDGQDWVSAGTPLEEFSGTCATDDQIYANVSSVGGRTTELARVGPESSTSLAAQALESRIIESRIACSASGVAVSTATVGGGSLRRLEGSALASAPELVADDVERAPTVRSHPDGIMVQWSPDVVTGRPETYTADEVVLLARSSEDGAVTRHTFAVDDGAGSPFVADVNTNEMLRLVTRYADDPGQSTLEIQVFKI